MNFNSILASVRGDGVNPSIPPKTKAAQANANGTPSSVNKATEGLSQSSGLKRKASGSPKEAPDKKLGRLSPTSAQVNSGGFRPGNAQNAALKSQPNNLVQAKVSTKPKPQPTTAAPLKASTTQSAAPKTAPAKGSYRELMARAQAARVAPQPALGRITHKAQTNKPTKRQQRLAKDSDQTETPRSPAKIKLAAMGKRIAAQGAKQSASASASQVAVPRRKTTELSYSGTMRPKDVDGSKSKGSEMKVQAQSSSAQVKPARARSKDDGYSRLYHYAGSSDEEEEEEEDYEDTDAENSDEMVGGGFGDLEDEEQESLRTAQKEDAIEKRREDQHRQEKLDRKRRLEALVKNKRR